MTGSVNLASLLSVEELNSAYAGLDAGALLKSLINDIFGPRLALVSSFGAESAVLLHMVAEIEPHLPVVFLDTSRLFAETLTYQTGLSAHLGLTNVRTIRPDPVDEAELDPDLTLSKTDPAACCFFRKTVPLRQALDGYSGWITGRKSYQADTRARLPKFERDGRHVKVNPLASWTPEDVSGYMVAHDLPAHPLVARGYPSIGCADCTTKVAPGEDPRSGRWRGQDKTECGIHFADGKAVRPGVAA